MRRVAGWCLLILAAVCGGAAVAADASFGTVTFAGKEVELHAVRLSACPFNQVWPGYQRPASQTKGGWFVQFDVAEPGWLAVEMAHVETTDQAREALRIRPLSRQSEVKVEDGKLLVKVERPEQFVMEFPGVAEDLHVFADPPFAYRHVPDEIYFGPGVHEAGMIRPKSGQTVCLAPGAYVYGCIFAADVADVKVVGRGVLDSSRMTRSLGDGNVLGNQMRNIRHGKGRWDLDNSTFTALATTNLTVEGITLVDAPFWAVILRDCCNTVFDNIKLVGMWRYNADGIDVCYSRNTTIRNSFIRSFDDCVVARGCQLNDEGLDVDGFVADNCVLWCDWGKNFEVWGSCKRGAIRNVTYRNSKCINPSHVVCNVTLQGGQGDIVYENITMENIEVDLVRPLMRSHLQKRTEPDATYPGGEEGAIMLAAIGCNSAGANSVTYRNIAIRNVRTNGDQSVGLVASVSLKAPRLKAENVVIEGLPARTDFRR